MLNSVIRKASYWHGTYVIIIAALSMNSISYFLLFQSRSIINSYLLPVKIFSDDTLQDKLNDTITHLHYETLI